MKEYLISLRTTAWRTAGARYNASRRLQQREYISTFSLASFSALSIAVAFAQRIYCPRSGTPLDNYLTAISVGLGVFLLAISLLEWGASYGLKADALHRNAEELTAYQLKLAQYLAQINNDGRTLADEQIEQFRVEYETIKNRCTYNHQPGDHQFFKAQHRTAPEFSSANGTPEMRVRDACLVVIFWYASTIWLFALAWLMVVGSMVFAWYIPNN
jgi:SMODS and SLOG-associating 2TM effector domain family 5